jgi:uroporphyrinogen III methyltransferase/synthase
MNRPLANRRFLVTRPQGQSENLATLLRDAGAEPLLAPMITIGDANDPAPFEAALGRLADFDLAVFISPTALDQIGARVANWPAELPVAVIGPTSKERAEQLGMAEVIVPDARYDSEGLLEHPALQQMVGKRVLLFRGNGGRELLAETLAARGATIEVVEAYRRLPPDMSCDELAAMIGEGCDGVIITSSEAVQNLFTLAGDTLGDTLRSQLFFASHPAVAEAARHLGVSRVIGTASGDAGVVATLAECFTSTPATSGGDAPAPVAAVASAAAPKPVGTPGHVMWALGVGVVCIAVSLLLYRSGSRDLQGEMGQQLASMQSELHQQSQRGESEGAHVGQVDAHLAQIEHQMEEMQAQQADLRALYSSVAGDQEEALLADAELTLSLASQQLQLTGNVGSALAALYRLDERLAGYDQAKLAPLRRALARDIDALKRVPWVDYVGLSARLDSLAGSVDKLPLVVDAKGPEESSQAPDTRKDGILGEFGRAIGALISIRRIDQPDPVLLPPDQALYLREHVKLRLLNARLALLQRDDATFRLDLTDADTELRKHFDVRAKAVVAALSTLHDVAAARPALQLPNLSDSVTAARDARRTVQKEDKQ